MAGPGTLANLRVALAEERSRLSGVLDQVDAALDCLATGAHKNGVDEPLRAVSFAGKGESHYLPASAMATQAGKRVTPQRTASHTPVSAWESSAPKDNSPIVNRTHSQPTRGTSLEQVDIKEFPPSANAGPLAASGKPRAPASPRPPGEAKDSGGTMTRANAQSMMQRVGLSRSGTNLDKLTAPTNSAYQSKKGRQIFANADQMKEQVQKAILEPEYNVRDMYSDRGVWQLVARHQIFDVLSLTVICLNALWLAVETDYNDEALLVNADTPFIVVENFFCAFFVGELLIRFMAFRVKADIFKDNWFLFDSGLVFFMAFETWILSFIVWASGGSFGASSSSTSVLRVVRLFRMTRAARVARLLKAVPELMVIGRGIVIVARTVVVIMCLLVMIIYTFAIVFTQLAKGTDLEKNVHPNAKCSDMVTTMSTLLLGGILPDFAPTTEDFAAEDFFFAAFFFMFILLAYVTIMNMLIGVLVEVVAVVASVEKETNQVAAVKRVLLKWTPDTDLDGDCRIGVDEFKNMLNNDGCAKDLNDVGVDAIALIDHADFVYRNKTELTFAELLAVVLGLRGRNDPKVQDLVQLRKFLHVEMLRIEMSLESLHTSLGLAQPPPSGLGGGSAFGEGSGFGERNGFGWGKGCGGNGFGGGGNCDTSAPEPPVHNAASVW